MIVLDTHIWHWWVNQILGKLSLGTIALIEESDEVGVSAMSCFEMAWLVRHGRIDLDMAFEEWLQQIEADRIIRFLPVTPWISARAVALPEHHKDPQDRIIIATALHNNARLISFLTSLVEQPQGRWRMSSSGDVSLFPDQISVQFSESAKFLCRPQA